MADPFGGLFFPLTSYKISRLFRAGDSFVTVVVSKGLSGYSSRFSSQGKSLKLTLERINDNEFTRALLQAYFFRQPDKEYGTHRQFLARLGFHKKDPLEMEYRDQKYVASLNVKHEGRPLELQLFFSPMVDRLVVRAIR